ncbi:hypothetical protein [Burkholderia ambifaria]|nr:hypothetical protein [Burkholderia ambifaria]
MAIDEWRETRTDGEGLRTVRRSTAVFRREAAGLTVRRHRREMPARA